MLSFHHVFRDRAQLSAEVPAYSECQKPWPHCIVGNVRGVLPPSLFNSVMFFLCRVNDRDSHGCGWDSQWLFKEDSPESFECKIPNPGRKGGSECLYVALLQRTKQWSVWIHNCYNGFQRWLRIMAKNVPKQNRNFSLLQDNRLMIKGLPHKHKKKTFQPVLRNPLFWFNEFKRL